jgi:transcriptional regulator with XRE-family HTH domain
MQPYEKIKLFRHLKGWSQEKVAEKLAMTVGGYGGLERGETDIQLSRLKQLAELFEIELTDLFTPENNTIHSSDGNSIINNFGYQQNHHWHIYSNDEIVELKHQLEIAELKNHNLEKEIAYLKQLLELTDKNK